MDSAHDRYEYVPNSCALRIDLPTVPVELVPSQPSTDGSNRATPPDSTHQFRLGPPLVASQVYSD
ncbi:hypothetical protein CYV19_13800 [Natronobacterium gregoryi SP2]|uniref:Uncharacterized protein n=1 Tax=Natronobacterium gregoryi (strain ATCC 43098 / DSM 3393 / CCM 3738 / CIP 104747 / IAM 13177 / JCM 8860 / NBRC 102187 / NCIMB 2189 / SP2) TaxID=797304 RepID=A0A2J4JCF3_NATGS|nr:hypothetical protein CYV19_13800 [Natronobacterium gregoryi SP2]